MKRNIRITPTSEIALPSSKRLRSVEGLPPCGRMYSSVKLSMSQMERKALFQAAQSDALRFSFCAPEARLKLRKMLSRDSASTTVQFITQYLSDKVGIKQVMLKIAFAEKPNNKDNSLTVERRIYKDVINPLLFNRATPHLVMYISEIRNCSLNNLRNILTQNQALGDAATRRQLQEWSKDAQDDGYNLKDMRALVLEMASGVKLGSFADASKPPMNFEAFWRPVIFQILWTLLCFRDVGLQHNDLHSDNVFVETYDTPVTRFYMLNQTTVFRLQTRYSVRLYDFDRSDKMSTDVNKCEIRNTRTSFPNGYDCRVLGACGNQYNQYRDIIRVLTTLVLDEQDRRVEPLASGLEREGVITSVNHLKALAPPKFAHYGAPCVKESPRAQRCRELPLAQQRAQFCNGNTLAQMIMKISRPDMLLRGKRTIKNACPLTNVYVRPAIQSDMGLRNCAVTDTRQQLNVALTEDGWQIV